MSIQVNKIPNQLQQYDLRTSNLWFNNISVQIQTNDCLIATKDDRLDSVIYPILRELIDFGVGFIHPETSRNRYKNLNGDFIC
jgi:hypothetical protein